MFPYWMVILILSGTALNLMQAHVLVDYHNLPQTFRNAGPTSLARSVHLLIESHYQSLRERAKSKEAAQRLKHMCWPLLRRGSRVRGRARQKLNALLASKLATARAGI